TCGVVGARLRIRGGLALGGDRLIERAGGLLRFGTLLLGIGTRRSGGGRGRILVAARLVGGLRARGRVGRGLLGGDALLLGGGARLLGRDARLVGGIARGERLLRLRLRIGEALLRLLRLGLRVGEALLRLLRLRARVG